MCVRVSSSMMLGYVLKNRERISYHELLEKRERLMQLGDGYVLDVSFRTISRVVSSYEDCMEIEFAQDEYLIKKKKCRDRGLIFSEPHLKMCYKELFPHRDFAQIVKILTQL